MNKKGGSRESKSRDQGFARIPADNGEMGIERCLVKGWSQEKGPEEIFRPRFQFPIRI
jgi:hypothetical protein